MVTLRDPARSVLKVREHRKHAKSPFAALPQLNGDTTYGSSRASRSCLSIAVSVGTKLLGVTFSQIRIGAAM